MVRRVSSSTAVGALARDERAGQLSGNRGQPCGVGRRVLDPLWADRDARADDTVLNTKLQNYIDAQSILEGGGNGRRSDNSSNIRERS